MLHCLQRIQLQSTKTLCGIAPAAIQQFCFNALHSAEPKQLTIEHIANGVVHPVTKEAITKYDKLANDLATKEVWQAAMHKELRRLAQGYNTAEGTNTVFFMSQNEIKTIPKDRTVTYA